MQNAHELANTFTEIYNCPNVESIRFCRAPGRVNIIGEHTDYNGLSVLPMTIDQDIRLAYLPRQDNRVRLHNINPQFAPTEFANTDHLLPSPTGSWDNYCKAAVEGLNRHFKVTHPPGMDVLVGGSIPISAGLSSSSALVVACALAYLDALGKKIETDVSRLTLAGLLAEAEHFVGTRGGGMDQAIILLGDEGHACKIDFFPLRVERVPLPKGFSFVVCNSFVKAEKTGDALHRYNAGPRLCQLITALVEQKAREEFGDEIRLERLGDLWQGHLCLTHAEVARLFDATFQQETMRLSEAAAQLGTSREAIRQRWLGDLREPPQGFRLQARARHQRTEYRRVENARDALLAGDAIELGQLMDASHRSCAGDYEVSCPELDALAAITRAAGAIGARLTGAGFGGCTVNLVPDKQEESFEANVQKKYYEEFLPPRRDGKTAEPIFVARSSPAAGYNVPQINHL